MKMSVRQLCEKYQLVFIKNHLCQQQWLAESQTKVHCIYVYIALIHRAHLF